ncbi:unnamed protein product [Closterium sp. Yama58-4]|nr:unnamed protein product [Closterium sp. Yama58-4]
MVTAEDAEGIASAEKSACAGGGTSAEGERSGGASPGRTRLLVTGSIAVSLLLWLPVWWYTTRVYRAPLPFADISSFADDVTTHPISLPIHVDVIFLLKSPPSSQQTEQQQKQQQQESSSRLFPTSQLQDAAKTSLSALCSPHAPAHGHSLSSPNDAALCGSKQARSVRLWAVRAAACQSALATSPAAAEPPAELPGEGWPCHIDWAQVLDAETQLSESEFDTWLDGRIQSAFSRSNLSKSASPSDNPPWDPVVLYFAPMAAAARWNERAGVHEVQASDLPFVLNADTWHLHASLPLMAHGRSKLLHVVVYIPSLATCPLTIATHAPTLGSNSNNNGHRQEPSAVPPSGFISPGWGSVILFNPLNCSAPSSSSSSSSSDAPSYASPHVLSPSAFTPVLAVAIAQLRSLFGLSATPPALCPTSPASPRADSSSSSSRGSSKGSKGAVGARSLSAGLRGVAEWEVDSLLRQRLPADEATIAASLSSVAALVQSLPSMVVRDDISEFVYSALSSARAAREAAREGRYDEAQAALRRAKLAADAALFHPSMEAGIFYPLEHHLAIYSPLFFPVGIHAAVAFIREMRRFLQRRRMEDDWDLEVHHGLVPTSSHSRFLPVPFAQPRQSDAESPKEIDQRWLRERETEDGGDAGTERFGAIEGMGGFGGIAASGVAVDPHGWLRAAACDSRPRNGRDVDGLDCRLRLARSNKKNADFAETDVIRQLRPVRCAPSSRLERSRLRGSSGWCNGAMTLLPLPSWSAVRLLLLLLPLALGPLGFCAHTVRAAAPALPGQGVAGDGSFESFPHPAYLTPSPCLTNPFPHIRVSRGALSAPPPASQLAQMKEIFDHDGRLQSWDAQRDCSTWQFVACNAQGHVIAISLRDFKANVTALPDGLSSLQYLTYLNLANNYFRGSFPSVLTLLTNLQMLDLSAAPLGFGAWGVTGSLPDGISALSRLTALSLAYNRLSGPLPNAIASLVNLRSLNLSFNYLSGSLPAALGDLPVLEDLDLTSNDFSGPIPNSFSGLQTLQTLALSSNGFSGPLPNVLTIATNLQSLSLSFNAFEGSIPRGITLLSTLRVLELANANISGDFPSMDRWTNLVALDLSFASGLRSVPLSLGFLTNLTRLTIERSGLTDTLPTQLCGLWQLRQLSLAHNAISGVLPDCMGNLQALESLLPTTIGNLRQITAINLAFNSFEGPLPTSLQALSFLQHLSLSHNALTGPLLPGLAAITGLTALEMSDNAFNGSLPLEFASLSSLSILSLARSGIAGALPHRFNYSTLLLLDLSGNRLRGELPRGFFPALSLLNLGSNRLKDDVDSFFARAHTPQLQSLLMGNNTLSGSLPDFTSVSPALYLAAFNGNAIMHTPKQLLSNSSLRLILADNPVCQDPSPASLAACSPPSQDQLSWTGIPVPACINTTCQSDALAPSPPVYAARAVCVCVPVAALDLLLLVPPVAAFNGAVAGRLQAALADAVSMPREQLRMHEAEAVAPSQQRVRVHVYPPALSDPDAALAQLKASLRLLRAALPMRLDFFGPVQEMVEDPRVVSPLAAANASASANSSTAPSDESAVSSAMVWIIVAVVVGVLLLTSLLLLLFLRRRSLAACNECDDTKAFAAGSASSSALHSARTSGPLPPPPATAPAGGAAARGAAGTTAAGGIGGGGVGQGEGNGGLSLVESVRQQLVRPMSLAELTEATQGFAEERELGSGAYGTVYRGEGADGQQWAVKRSKLVSRDTMQVFRKEVSVISQMSHRHLVKLLGYCDTDREHILVYEFVPNGTLAQHLRPKPGERWAALSFEQRVDIALGTAQALQYLHSFGTPAIIHRDVKSDNILLTDTMQAKVSDFGLLKDMDDADAATSKVAGTPGYLDPEYYRTFKVTTKSDVFSFGVVLLELVTGLPPTFPNPNKETEGMISLAEWALARLGPDHLEARLDKVADVRMEGQYVRSALRQMVELATHCVRLLGKNRPDMHEVVWRLQEVQQDMALARGQAAPPRSRSDMDAEEAMAYGSFPTSWIGVGSRSHVEVGGGGGAAGSGVAKGVREQREMGEWGSGRVSSVRNPELFVKLGGAGGSGVGGSGVEGQVAVDSRGGSRQGSGVTGSGGGRGVSSSGSGSGSGVMMDMRSSSSASMYMPVPTDAAVPSTRGPARPWGA